MANSFTEATVEQAALSWLQQVGYTPVFGGSIAPGEPAAERASYGEVLLIGRLRAALQRINPQVPPAALDDVIRKVSRAASGTLIQRNDAFHRLLVEGVDVSYRAGGAVKHDKVWLVDFATPTQNDWLAVNQFTVTDVNAQSKTKTNRRPDIVLFVNGLPLAVIELKNAANPDADIRRAFNQLHTYQNDIPSLFTYNALMVISDGTNARVGVLGAGWEWFKPWRTIDGETVDPAGVTQLEMLIRGVFDPAYFLDLVRHFTVFERGDTHLIKKLAAYHQFHAVNRALAKTLEATAAQGNQRVGVVWHTQGSGKSLSMLFYAGKIIQHPRMENPTVIILTDRNDLDDQLFGVFAGGQDLLRQTPQQATNRDHLKQLLSVASGGVIFTTIQKFLPDDRGEFPLLSERRNIVFIADEAHRSQYGFNARIVQGKDAAYVGYGFAKYVRDALPNASFIGFTGTPVELTDANTRQVFGDYIDIYDIQRAIDDGATVPIYYEQRLVKLHLLDDYRSQIDPEFEDVTEGEEPELKEQLKSKWSQFEAMVGAAPRLAEVANDIVNHFEARLTIFDGKAMIVCMSRRIAVELYAEIIKLRPQWHSDTDDAGAIKVVMTGSADDPPEYQPHSRNKPRRKALAERFKDPADPLKLVIVRDMWLTGFDAPPMHTLYIDKPMHGHGLMQAIARVNRVYKDKPGGLIVDYLGIAPDLQQAIADYTANKSAAPTKPLDEAVDFMLTQYEIAKGFFRHFDYSRFFTGQPAERLSMIPAAMEHILKHQDGKKRYMDVVLRLSQAFALSLPHPEAIGIRDDVAFFQAIRAAFAKSTPVEGRTRDDLDGAVRQIVSQAIGSPEVIDIFRAAGLKAPDISILSDQFLGEIQAIPYKNLALELLRKLLNDEIKARTRQNVVLARSFADLLDEALRRYQNRAIDAVEVVSELVEIARGLRQASQRGESLGLNDAELAFYDALAESKSAIEVMGDVQLAVIARELVATVRASLTIDWSVKQNARAQIRVLVKRILRKYGYPPDLQEKAADTVLEQAEVIAGVWVTEVEA